MSMCNACVSGNDIKAGSMISLRAKAAQPGDNLSIEYPNDSRASGTAITASPNELEIEVDSEKWRLRPHAQSDGTVHNNLAGKDASFWTVQTKI